MTSDVELPAHRDQHRLMLVFSILAIVLSFLLVVRADQRVALWFLPQLPVPETCIARSGFGIPCPGCGLTRSFISLARLDFAAAWQFHRLGWLLAAVTLAQVPYRLWALSHPTGEPLGIRWPRWFGWSLLTALLINGILRWCGL